MNRIVQAMDVAKDLEVHDFWKQFNIADCLNLIEETIADVKPQFINLCWRTLA